VREIEVLMQWGHVLVKSDTLNCQIGFRTLAYDILQTNKTPSLQVDPHHYIGACSTYCRTCTVDNRRDKLWLALESFETSLVYIKDKALSPEFRQGLS
jgi:hypothetical protein